MDATAMDKSAYCTQNMYVAARRTRKTNEFNPMEIVIYLCRLFTAVDGCGWMRWCAKCNLHKMKFRNSVSLREWFGDLCWNLAPYFPLPLSMFQIAPSLPPSLSLFLLSSICLSSDSVSRPSAAVLMKIYIVFGMECNILYYLSNQMKQKEKQNRAEYVYTGAKILVCITHGCVEPMCIFYSW